MKDLFNTKMDTHGGYGHPLRFPAKYTVSIHRYIWYVTIFGLSALLAVLSCMVYFDCGFGFLEPLKLGAVGSYISGEGFVVVETGQIQELGGVGNYNSSERNTIGETGQQQKLGGVGDNRTGEGIVVDEAGQQKQLGGVGDKNAGEEIVVDEKRQQKQLGGVGDNHTGEGIVVDEAGQQKQLGGVGDKNIGEEIVVDEKGQQKQLGGVGDKNSGEEIVVDETGQQKKLGGFGDKNTDEGIMGHETGQQKQLGGVGDKNTTEGIMVNETGQQKQPGVVGDKDSTEGIMSDETGKQKQLGGVRDNDNGEEIMADETGQQKQPGVAGDKDSAERIMVNETGQKKQLGGVSDNDNGEEIMGDETGQQKQLGDVRGNNSGEGLVGLKGKKKQLGECDLSVGVWVRDEAYPIYQSQNCPFMDSGFRCQENGRPDSDYLKWRWQPSDCDLPRFDPRKFLQSIQNKRIVFVGDSIGRNQWESMVCMLAEAVADKTRIYEVNGNPITKHMGYLSFRFKDYNCTVEYYRAPFLVYQGRAPVGSPPEVRTTLRVDRLDSTSKLWVNADILVFNTGHWWNYEKTVRWGCYFQEGKTVNIKMDVETAFQKSMNTWAEWIRQHVDSERSHVFLRTYSPVHFRDGTWKTGGQCHEETWPNLNSSSWGESWKTRIMTEAVQHLQDRKNVQSLNITYSAQMRKDGHPSIYYVGKANGPAPIKKQDCSHWCLPGVPDQWNHLLYSYLIARGYGDLGTRVSRK